MRDENKHYCHAPKEAKSYQYGVAVLECWQEEDGTLTVDNGEYASQVNYCPYCGYEADVKIGEND